MTGIEAYSTTAASNNATPPNGWPEGQAPSTVNDCARQMMASIRTWYESAEWINWGDTCVYVSSTSFKIAGSDVTARYVVGRRVKAVGSSTGTIYGKIITSAFSTDTTVTLVWDSGSLSNETLTVSIALVKGASASARSIDLDAVTFHGSDVASATTIVLDSATGDLVDVTGTTTITAITLAEGRVRTVRFTGILTLTNGASLVLPGSANITTAAGDYAIFRGYSGAVVRCVFYSKLSGLPIVAPSVTAFTVPRRQVFASTGTYTPNANMLYCEIWGIGGGGGGGGCSAVSGATAGGGAAGSECRLLASKATIGVSQAVTIGAGGTAGANTGGNGGTGGTTTVGALISATGGLGGGGSTGASSPGGAGQAATAGDILGTGAPGGPGVAGSSNTLDASGVGGSSSLGGGAISVVGSSAANGNNGVDNTGGGGSGANAGSGTAKTGGIGGKGYVIITEYCSA